MSTAATAVYDNPIVQEAISQFSKEGQDPTLLLTLLHHISSLHVEIGNMQATQEALLKEAQTLRHRQEHPIAAFVERKAEQVGTKLSQARELLASVGKFIVDLCKRIVETAKALGSAAFRGAMRVMGITDGMESLRNTLNGCARQCDEAAVKVAAMSAEYREAGRHMRNVRNTLAGKEPEQDVRPMGRLADGAQKMFTAMAQGARKGAARADASLAVLRGDPQANYVQGDGFVMIAPQPQRVAGERASAKDSLRGMKSKSTPPPIQAQPAKEPTR